MFENIPIKLIFFALVLAATLFEVVGDVFFKKWSLDNNNIILIAGFIIYFIGTVFWAFSLKYEGLAKSISILTVLNLIVVVLVGVLYFKEDLSLVNKVGIVLGIVSVALIEL
ncbi:MAG: EamA family transporter [archaeon]|jgi:multidrug transporter EmrE-like cation transporter